MCCVAVDYLSVVVRCLNSDDMSVLSASNTVQREAINHAVSQSFSLIQGPPGTSKTLTTVRLAGLFVRINQNLPDEYKRQNTGAQLMICAPSDKTVDFITSELSLLSLIMNQAVFTCHLVCITAITAM